MQRILAIWLPNWPVQRRIVAQPELAGRAVVLHERDARRGELVRACSASAVARGILPGMPLAEAAALLRDASAKSSRTAGTGSAVDARGVPEGTGGFSVELPEAPYVACHEPAEDREALLQLALGCEQFSPLVGLDEGDQPDSLRMDIRGLAGLFGGERSMAGQVAEFFRRGGYQVRVAVADTPAAAAALARWGRADGPCSIVIAAQGDPTVLADLPVAALRLSEAAEQQLRHLGLDRLGQLQGLPRGSLAARLGSQLLQRLDRITGAANEVLVACHPPADLTVQYCFEHPVTHPEAIEWGLQLLLQQLSRRLIVQGLGVLQLECQLVCQNRLTRQIRIDLFQPAVDPGHLMALLRLQLEHLDLPEALQELRLAAVSTAERQQRQGELFADATPGDPAKLALLIERLSNRLGRERVVRAELQADALVERAYCCRPLTGERAPRGGAAPASDVPAPGPMFRPLRLFDPPRPIDVVGIALDGPPAKFFYQRQAYGIARSFGPERIETGWWRGPSVRRDYYRVETTAGNRLWLFRRLQDQQWFWHGEFA